MKCVSKSPNFKTELDLFGNRTGLLNTLETSGYHKAMINTYNESALHETLKEIYATESGGKTEAPIPGTQFVADILNGDGSAIEIQTGSVGALRKKIEFFCENGRKIKVVRPILIEKAIENYDENGNLISRKRSPKRETVYSVLRGLSGVHHLLGKFELEIPFVKATEKRLQTEEKTQLLNRSRRHLKNWLPLGKVLDSIEGEARFLEKTDFLNLIPEKILNSTEDFTLRELSDEIENQKYPYPVSKTNRKEAAKWTKLLLWILEKAELAERAGKKGNAILWKIRS